MNRFISIIAWVAVASLGAMAYATLALHRGEAINSSYILVAALCSYAVGYRFYSKWIAARVLSLNDRRATPCLAHEDGHDFVKTNKWIVFGHHFAAISGPGPLVGPVLAAQFGYLPGTLWILLGVTLGGAVQDFIILFCSIRRDGKSLAQMVKEELSSGTGLIALVAILAILTILLSVLGLVVVRALAESPWGVFTVGATIPIAMLMGGYLRFWRIGKVLEASCIGVALLMLAVWGGKLVHQNPTWSHLFSLGDLTLAWMLIGYGLAASALPVWLLLAPRDYLSTFMKLGTILALALGIFIVLPNLQMPPLTRFVDGSGLVVAGKIFPFCFITIACGAISGFHSLVASGTTPKLITRESYARPIGYGAMCLESLVAIMALIAACTLSPGVYLSMNIKGDPNVTVAKAASVGFPVDKASMEQLASQLGEKTLFGRTGGAATLAVGMASIFAKAVNGRWLDLWYHFAIMFEALFILTTMDAGTRVGRYLLQDALGHIWKPLGETRRVSANVFSSALMVAAWGLFLIQGVRDPLGGINSLWPLFGIANQMLAAIALCLATTVILKMELSKRLDHHGANKGLFTQSKPAFALLTLVPLLWLVTVTMTAGVEKIGHSDPRIGFLAQARSLSENRVFLEAELHKAAETGDAEAINKARKALRTNVVLRFNNVLDAIVAAALLSLTALVVLSSMKQWLGFITGRRTPALAETLPLWLPENMSNETSSVKLAGVFPLALALARELSVEGSFERETKSTAVCEARAIDAAGREAQAVKHEASVYVHLSQRRYSTVRRCC